MKSPRIGSPTSQNSSEQAATNDSKNLSTTRPLRFMATISALEEGGNE